MSDSRSLADWLALLEQRHTQQIRLGLDRVEKVRARLNTTSTVPLIVVGGTNGKGSVCALLEAMLGAAGYRTGVYTSPHFLRFNERMRVAGMPVDDAAIVRALEQVDSARGDIELTYFEHGTLAAWLLFEHAAVDVMVLEVGLGGRLDAVNVFDADCAVLTSIDMDHQSYLGSSREKIGFEKAGIMRAGVPVVCADPDPPRSVVTHAENIGAIMYLRGRDFGAVNQGQQWHFWLSGRDDTRDVRRAGLAHPALRGAHQLGNAAAAMACLELLRHRLPVPMQAVRQGMNAVVPGRFQCVPGRPAVVLDVAHNGQAAHALADSLLKMGFFPETLAVMAVNADKDVAAIARELEPRIDRWFVASLPGTRGLSASALAERLRQAGVVREINCFPSVAAAYASARTAAGDSDRIAVFGSFVTVADVMREIQLAGKGGSSE